MTTLDPNDHYTVLINTFTVNPDRAEELLDELSTATEKTLRHMPGFVSANFHLSEDERHVANYGQWKSRSDYDAIFDDEAVTAHFKRAADIAESYEPIYYELRSVHDTPAS